MDDTTALVASLLVSLRPLRPQLLGSVRLRPTPRPSWPRCISTFGKYSPSLSAPNVSADPTVLVVSLLVSPRSIQPSLLGSLRRRPTPRPSWPHCLLAFGPYGSSSLATSPPDVPSVALTAPQPRLRLTPGPSKSRCLSGLGVYGPSLSAPAASADPTALVVSLLVSLWSIQPSLRGSIRHRRFHLLGNVWPDCS